jgi:hypothetical protein
MAGRVPAIRRGTDADGDGRDKPYQIHTSLPSSQP